MESLYPNSDILTKLASYLRPFFVGFSERTRRQLIWIAVAMPAVGAVHSARSLHAEFLSQLNIASLNALYYALSCAKRPAKRLFAGCPMQLALRAIPDHLRAAPCFLSIDDTLVPKFGRRFDHAAHNVQPYKNGHCFVCIVLSVPISSDHAKKRVRPLGIPLLLCL